MTSLIMAQLNSVFGVTMASYEDFQVFCKQNKIMSENQWRQYKRNNTLPINIPPSPEKYYKDVWQGWSYATRGIAPINVNRKWLPF